MEMIKLQLGTNPTNPIDCAKHVEHVLENAGRDDQRWWDLWKGQMRTTHEQSVGALASALREGCRNLVVIGIGGSSLGAKAIHGALSGSNWNLLKHGERDGPRLFFLDNIDPETAASTYAIVKSDDPAMKHTVVCVISKSGETIEIAANLMIARQKLPNATYVAITSESGSLCTVAKEQNWRTLVVPEGVGGRFSVLSPVGLFPAAMCGVDIAELLDGANAMCCTCTQIENNLAASLAAFLMGHASEGRTIQVMMPYCDGLSDLAAWWVQLWAESLGKCDDQGTRTGPTPIAATGATDQHSVLQLWREGPTDKVIGFVGTEHMQDLNLGDSTISSNLQWLGNKTMGEVLFAQQEATTDVVAQAGQATWTLTLPMVNAASLGQFFALWQIATAIAGRILCVNPYDQPGVELGKLLAARKLRGDQPSS